MTESELVAYIEGFIKAASDEGLSQPEALELMMKLAADTSIDFPEDQMVDVD
jgi:hypothetical protein